MGKNNKNLPEQIFIYPLEAVNYVKFCNIMQYFYIPEKYPVRGIDDRSKFML